MDSSNPTFDWGSILEDVANTGFQDANYQLDNYLNSVQGYQPQYQPPVQGSFFDTYNTGLGAGSGNFFVLLAVVGVAAYLLFKG